MFTSRDKHTSKVRFTNVHASQWTSIAICERTFSAIPVSTSSNSRPEGGCRTTDMGKGARNGGKASSQGDDGLLCPAQLPLLALSSQVGAPKRRKCSSRLGGHPPPTDRCAWLSIESCAARAARKVPAPKFKFDTHRAVNGKCYFLP